MMAPWSLAGCPAGGFRADSRGANGCLYSSALFNSPSPSGRGAGVRQGDWTLQLVESGDIQDDGWLCLEGLREIDLVRSSRTERYVLQPFDLLVTARSGSVQLAIVPSQVPGIVAGVTLLVVRAGAPESGMGHYLWYYLTSSDGRRQLVKRLTVNATITSLSAGAIADVEIPLPSSRQLTQIANLVEASEEAYTAAINVAKLRREMVRDSVISEIVSRVA